MNKKTNIKRFYLVWRLYRVISWLRGEFQPRFGTVGYLVQSDIWTEDEAKDFLDRTHRH